MTFRNSSRVTAQESAGIIQCAYRCSLAVRHLRKNQERHDGKPMRARMQNIERTSTPQQSLNDVQPVEEFQGPELDDQTDPQRIQALRRWAQASLTRSFKRWRVYIEILHDKVQIGQSALKNLMHGDLFQYFRQWADILAAYGDSVTPWRSHPGQMVGLSKDGREYEFLHGERLEGDTECGVLIEPVLSDKSVWKVRWLASGKKPRTLQAQ